MITLTDICVSATLFLAAHLAHAACPSWPTAERFEFHGDEVTDRFSGQVWQRCSVGQTWSQSANTCTGSAKFFTYDEAMALSKAAQIDHPESGWRLPHVKELARLTDKGCENPSIDKTAFPATPKNWYWSASVYVGFPTFAWVVYFNNTNGSASYGGGKRITPYLVRWVRNGP